MSNPSRSPRSRRFFRVGVFFATAVALACGPVGLLATPASASLLSTVAGVFPTCPVRPTATTFAAWGDQRSYFAMPGGGFESGAPGWAFTGSNVVSANESSFVNAKTDGHSLAMPTGARAVSPTVCVSMGENTIRFFVKNSGVAGSVLHVQASVQNPLTGLVLSTGVDIQGGAGSTGWAPSNPILIPNLLGGLLGTQKLTLTFTNTGKPGTWTIDDVFVDPFKSR
jgi:hypothetical protein